MKYLPKAAYLFVLFVLVAFSPSKGEQSKSVTGSDSLKYIGHAFVKIKTMEGIVIYIDPFNVNDFSDSADVVLITHEHSDHNDLTRVKRKTTCQVIRSANAEINGVYQSFTIGNIKITAVPAYNSNHPKASCVGYVLEFDNIKLYHSGDTGKIPEMADLASQNITYALLPMDAVYTMTPEQATEAADMIKAKYSIPIHTMPPPDTYSEPNVAKFTPANKLVVHPLETIALESNVSDVGNIPQAPKTYSLEQNYPNPFNPSTTISYTIPTGSYVSLKIFDVLGKEVTTVVNEYQQAGEYKIRYSGNGLSSGIYFLMIKANDFTDVKKFVLMK